MSFLFDDPDNKLHWKPFYIQVIRQWWMGNTMSEIANLVGASPSLVKKIIESERGQQILAQLEDNTFQSMLEVQAIAQGSAIEMIQEKIRLALYSGDEKIRTKNSSDVLAIAGHSVNKITIDRPEPLADKYRDKTELDIRKELLAIKQVAGPVSNAQETTEAETVEIKSESGPDGKLIN